MLGSISGEAMRHCVTVSFARSVQNGRYSPLDTLDALRSEIESRICQTRVSEFFTILIGGTGIAAVLLF